MKYLKTILEFRKDAIKGGKGDKTSKKDIDPKQLLVGTEVEKEHTKDKEKAEEIAIDHLEEKPKYYTKLIKAKMVDEKPALKLAKKLGIS